MRGKIYSEKTGFKFGAAWLIGLILFCAAFGQQKTNDAVYQNQYLLKPNERIERRLAKDEKHFYTINLKRGELLHIRVEQHGIDVLMAIGKNDTEKKIVLQTDHAATAEGTESFAFAAETGGEYIFGVFGFDAVSNDSGYVLQNTAPLTSIEEKQFAAADLEKIGLAAYQNKTYDSAIFYHENALKLRQSLPASTELASLYFRLGGDFYDAGKYEKAIEFYLKAAPIYHQFADQANEAISFLNIGSALVNLKKYEQSALAYQKALPILITASDTDNQAETLLKLGENYENLQDYEKSTSYFEQALVVFHRSQSKFDEAYILFNIAGNYFSRSEYEKSLEYYQRTLPLFQKSNDVGGKAVALSNIGLIFAKLEQQDKAVDYLKQALVLARNINDKFQEANVRRIIGEAYLETGRSGDALEQFGQSLEGSRKSYSSLLEIAALRGIGASYSELGNYDAAIKNHNDALKIADALRDESEQTVQYVNLALVYMELGQYDRSFEYNRKAMEIEQRLKDKYSERVILNNLGVAYLRLGSFSRAEKYIQDSAKISYELKEKRSIAIADSNLGAVYARLKQYEKAIAYFEKALPLLKEFKSYRILVTTDYYYGTVRRERGELDKAVALHQEAVTIARTARTPKFEARAQIELGLDYLAQSKAELAAVNFQEALNIAREVKAREEQSAALDGLMQSHNRLGQTHLAIFYGKQSINLLQTIRNEIGKFDKDIQTNFVKDNERTYRQLAETLISEGRIPEANQVLAMLKEEELSGFVRRDAKEIETLSKRADLRADEKSALERYNLFSSKVTAIGAEFAKLEDTKRRLTAGETFAEQARYEELAAQLKDANTAFRVFLEKELAAELGKEKKKEIEQDRALQGKLKSWGAGTVALSTIVGADRYRIILTTSNTEIDGKTEITAADLNAKIFAFREALLNPTIDPKPLGKELYDILIKPIEKDLEAASAKTLLWSLDGTLRYIPIAALWDGDEYLLQKYQNVIVTSTTRQSLQAEVNKNWQILGAGVTKASEITDANTAQKYSFDELKSVAKELSVVVGDSKAKGVSTGVSLIDTSFTEAALKDELTQMTDDKRRFNVVHFATHFRLGSDTADSFLLLGNNKALTLAEVADSPEMNLTDVELVTLSACNTGFGGLENSKIFAENNGKEVDSLAQFIELRGAKSVMATLWSVADESTAILMGEFYRLRKENQNWTKAETLRQAQLELLNGKYTPEQISKRNRSEAVRFGKSAKDMPKFVKDENAPFAHPFYWSPFVLIGNWR